MQDVVEEIAFQLHESDASCEAIRNLALGMLGRHVDWGNLGWRVGIRVLDNTASGFLSACQHARQMRAWSASVRRAHVPHTLWMRPNVIVHAGNKFWRTVHVTPTGIKAVPVHRYGKVGFRANPGAPVEWAKAVTRVAGRRKQALFAHSENSLFVWKPDKA
jgi:hypothetical protein